MTEPRLLPLALSLVLFAGVLSAQTPAGEEAPATRPTPADPALTLMKEIDERIYDARTAGLKDLQVDWKIDGAGYLADELAKYALRYSWLKPDHWLVGVLTRDLEPVEALPDVFKSEEGAATLQRLAQSMHQTIQQLVVGAPLGLLYDDYHAEVREREVNDEVEHRLILTPKSKKTFTQVSIRVVRGLPREYRKTGEDGSTVVHRYLYEEREGRHLVTGMKVEINNRTALEESYAYVKVDGYHLVSRIERLLGEAVGEAAGRASRQVVVFENHRVDQGLPRSTFGLEEEEEAGPQTRPAGEAEGAD